MPYLSVSPRARGLLQNARILIDVGEHMHDSLEFEEEEASYQGYPS